MSSRKPPSPEQDGDWVLYDQDEDLQAHEKLTLRETTICGSPDAADVLSMSYLDISQANNPTENIKMTNQFVEFTHEEDHDRSLPSESSEAPPLSVDVCEASLPLEDSSLPFKSGLSFSPNLHKELEEEEEEELSPAPSPRPPSPGHGPEDPEWWAKINGYGLAAFVVGTASLVAYSMARKR
jgi:hypothetical protein